MAQTFKKSERLYHRKAIESLFDRTNPSNKSLLFFPIRLVYRPSDLAGPRVLFSVSKRAFKRAVDRNLLKRRLREAYRLHKEILNCKGIDLALVFVSKEIVPFSEIEKAIVQILAKLQNV